MSQNVGFLRQDWYETMTGARHRFDMIATINLIFDRSNIVELELSNVGKQYSKQKWGIANISLKLTNGVWGLLGPNGAGKSTLMRVLATITKPTEGRVLWNGKDIVQSPNSLRSVLGYLPQDFGVYPNLNAVEFLHYMAAIKGLNRRTADRKIEELLQVVNLAEARKRPLGTYSGGMKQRVGIAQALLNDPKLLIVDEPTVGLDPEERVRFRNLLANLSGDRIVILSTHIVSDIEAAASGIALINKGELVRFTSPEEMLKLADGKVWEWIVSSKQLPEIQINMLISSISRRSDGAHLRVVGTNPPAPDSHPVSANLEDAYLYITSLI